MDTEKGCEGMHIPQITVITVHSDGSHATDGKTTKHKSRENGLSGNDSEPVIQTYLKARQPGELHRAAANIRGRGVPHKKGLKTSS